MRCSRTEAMKNDTIPIASKSSINYKAPDSPFEEMTGPFSLGNHAEFICW